MRRSLSTPELDDARHLVARREKAIEELEEAELLGAALVDAAVGLVAGIGAGDDSPLVLRDPLGVPGELVIGATSPPRTG